MALINKMLPLVFVASFWGVARIIRVRNVSSALLLNLLNIGSNFLVNQQVECLFGLGANMLLSKLYAYLIFLIFRLN